MICGDGLGDPASHGPAAEFDLMEIECVHEGDDGGGFVCDGVREVGGLLAAAVAGKVGHDDAIAGLGEVGSEVAPVFSVAAEAVDEEDGRAVCGAESFVVDADAVDLDGVGFSAGETEFDGLICAEAVEGTFVEEDAAADDK